MGYMTNGLTFNALRGANCARLPEFKNARGEPAHSEPDGSDWTLSAWSNAVLGELGEAANIIKKVERGDLTLDEARPALAKEFADVATYLDILAFRAGVDLGRATIDKFNEVSDRVGSRVYLSEDDWHYRDNTMSDWQKQISEWLGNDLLPEPLTTEKIFEHCIRPLPAFISRPDSMRVAYIMKRLGFVQKRQRMPYTDQVVRAWVQPATVLTCVYCGHEYPQGTPPAGDQILTNHIRECAKHPLRKAEATIKLLRNALAGVVGASDPQELRGIEAAMRTLPAPGEDKEVTINAIHALLETSEGAQ